MGSGYIEKSLKYYFARYVLQKKYLVARADAHELLFRFRIEDTVGRHIYKKGSYESLVTDYILDNIRFEEGDSFIDVGANIGWYSLLLAKGMRKNISVFAFEPDPLNFRLLNENVALNGAANIRTIRKALSDTEDSRPLYLYPHKNRGRHSLLPINDGERIMVETTTLDSFVLSEGISPEKVAFVKIDVEGYELNVLQGAGLLLDTVPVFLCEYSPSAMKRCGLDPRRIVSLFMDKDYSAHELGQGGLRAVGAADFDSMDEDGRNIFWIKRRK